MCRSVKGCYRRLRVNAKSADSRPQEDAMPAKAIVGAGVFAALVFTSGPSRAADESVMTGSNLQKLCSAYPSPGTLSTAVSNGPAGMCFGYVNGVTDMMIALVPNATCPPQGVLLDQTTRIVIKYLADHPEELHEPGAAIVMSALAKAFPCRK